jgi:glucose-6-phosphate 1-epimerase
VSLVEAATAEQIPSLHLRHPCGDTAVVALHGAHVLSWVAAGRERLYLSPRAVMDGQGAIRGGVPVCFPQFNLRGPLPKHGFVRNLAWQGTMPQELAESGAVQLELSLQDDERSRAFWPLASFSLRLVVTLAPGSLRVALHAHNCGADPWSFTGALHTYLRVDDIAQAAVDGLAGRARWDALTQEHSVQRDAVQFTGEYDSVFSAAPGPLVLHDGAQRLAIEQSPAFANTVVWNPGSALCARLPDMPVEGYQHMLCVEAAQVDSPVTVPPGAHWAGWQQLRVLDNGAPGT